MLAPLAKNRKKILAGRSRTTLQYSSRAICVQYTHRQLVPPLAPVGGGGSHDRGVFFRVPRDLWQVSKR